MMKVPARTDLLCGEEEYQQELAKRGFALSCKKESLVASATRSETLNIGNIAQPFRRQFTEKVLLWKC